MRCNRGLALWKVGAVAAVLVILARSPAAAADDGWVELSNDLNQFRATGQWFIAGNAQLDPKNAGRLVGTPGRGVLINGKEGITNDLRTRQTWGDVEVSLEFMIPRHSNSGVKLQGAYEVQIFDSHNAAKATASDCGGIYPRAELTPGYHYIDKGFPPRVNAAKPAGQWQTLEILFRAPRFDKDGHKIANARFDKVVLNGQVVQEDVEVPYPTGHYWHNAEHARGPLLFQGDHGPVAFRAVRVRALRELKTPPASS